MFKDKSLSPIEAFADFYLRWRFSILLLTMAMLNACRMATLGMVQDQLIFDACGTAVFASATLSLCIQKKTRVIGLILGIPAITLLFTRSLASEVVKHYVIIAGRISCILFLAFMISIIILTLLNQSPASRDSIAGAFCGYVLIGVMFAEAYCLLDAIDPNSFNIETTKLAWSDGALRSWMSLEYFSFTTLTTVGFGDVVPTTPLSRFLAIWEAICGQFYLAVLVAGLVNLRAAGVSTGSDQKSSDLDLSKKQP